MGCILGDLTSNQDHRGRDDECKILGSTELGKALLGDGNRTPVLTRGTILTAELLLCIPHIYVYSDHSHIFHFLYYYVLILVLVSLDILQNFHSSGHPCKVRFLIFFRFVKLNICSNRFEIFAWEESLQGPLRGKEKPLVHTKSLVCGLGTWAVPALHSQKKLKSLYKEGEGRK